LHCIKFPSYTKDRTSTKALPYKFIPEPFTDITELHTILTQYNTFFSSSSLNEEKLHLTKFRQSDTSNKYVHQSDCRSDYTHILILDIDRDNNLTTQTATNRKEVLQDLANHIKSPIVWVPSNTETRVLSGRVFIPLVSKQPKAVLKQYIEEYFYAKYNSQYFIPNYVANLRYALGLSKSYTAKHEFNDRAAFNPTQKLNIYHHSIAKMETYLYNNDTTIRFGNKSSISRAVKSIDIPTDITNNATLKQYAEDYIANKGWDILDKHNLNSQLRKLERAIYPIDTVFLDKSGNEWTIDSLKQQDNDFELADKDNPRPDGKYPFRYYPTTKEGIISQTIWKFDNGGAKTVLSFETKDQYLPDSTYILDKMKQEYVGTHCPNLRDELLTHHVSILRGETGIGKSILMANLENGLLAVPTQNIRDDLANQEGYMAVYSKAEKGENKTIKPSKLTQVMTIDKLSGHLKNKDFDFSSYTIIIDEVHTAFPPPLPQDKPTDMSYKKSKASISQSLIESKNAFKNIICMSANYNTYQQLHRYLPKEHYYVEVKYSNLPTIEITTQKNPDLTSLGRVAIYCNSVNKGKQIQEHLLLSGVKAEFIEADSKDRLQYIPKADAVVFTSTMQVGYSLPGEWDTIVVYTDKARQISPTGVCETIQAASRTRKVRRIIVIHSGKKLPYSIPKYEDFAEAAKAYMFDTEGAYKKESKLLATKLPGASLLPRMITGDKQVGYTLYPHLITGHIAFLQSVAEMNNIDLFIDGLEEAGYKTKLIKLSEGFKPEKADKVDITSATSLMEVFDILKDDKNKLDEVRSKLDRITDTLKDTIDYNIDEAAQLKLIQDDRLFKKFTNQFNYDIFRRSLGKGYPALFGRHKINDKNMCITKLIKSYYKEKVKPITTSEVKKLGQSPPIAMIVVIKYLDSLGLDYYFCTKEGEPFTPICKGRGAQITGWRSKFIRAEDEKLKLNKKLKRLGKRAITKAISYPSGQYITILDPKEEIDKLYTEIEI